MNGRKTFDLEMRNMQKYKGYWMYNGDGRGTWVKIRGNGLEYKSRHFRPEFMMPTERKKKHGRKKSRTKKRKRKYRNEEEKRLVEETRICKHFHRWMD